MLDGISRTVRSERRRLRLGRIGMLRSAAFCNVPLLN
jgi:hypothetical protein